MTATLQELEGLLVGKSYEIAYEGGNIFSILGTLRSWFRQLSISASTSELFFQEVYEQGDYDQTLAWISERTGIRWTKEGERFFPAQKRDEPSADNLPTQERSG